jgi:hypothetical protein
MGFSLHYHPDVREVDLSLLDRKTKERVRKAITERLQTAPQDYGIQFRLETTSPMSVKDTKECRPRIATHGTRLAVGSSSGPYPG